MTSEQRAQILQVYLTRGFTAAAPLAIACGCSPKVMSKWARDTGHKGTRGREPGVWKATSSDMAPAKMQIRKYQRKIDPRWQWAIDRGEIRI